MVDHLGFPIAMELTAANVGDREGLRLIIERPDSPIPPVLFVDTGYRGKDFERECQRYGIELKPVPRNQGWSLDKQTMETIKGFNLVAKRWIVERSFAWVGKCRRMAKDYELLLTVSKSMLMLVFVRLLLERLG